MISEYNGNFWQGFYFLVKKTTICLRMTANEIYPQGMGCPEAEGLFFRVWVSKLFKGGLQEANNFFLALVVFMSTSTAKSSGFSNIKEEKLGNGHNRVLAIAIGLTKIDHWKPQIHRTPCPGEDKLNKYPLIPLYDTLKQG